MADSRKTVLITGCSPGGIGNALAREFHARGLRVLATARKTATIQDLADVGIETLSLEVDDEQSIDACREQVAQAVGDVGLSYLVNNAGRNYAVPALDVVRAEIDAVFATNVFAVMRLCQAFMPLLMRGRGTIVQIGSVGATFPYAWGSVYNASKAALHSYSANLRVEVAPLGVHVIVVVTAAVKSNIARVQRRLGEDSLYKALEEDYQKRQVQSQRRGQHATAYAKDVVPQVLGAEGYLWRTRTIWAGGGAGLVRWMSWLMPESAMAWMVSRMFGFEKLRGIEGKKTV